jgi:hypothetical protein
MNAPRTCLICGCPLEPGFALDKGHYDHRSSQEWWEGSPQKSFWTGLKKPDRRYRILSFRCTSCGYLMDFANPEESPV